MLYALKMATRYLTASKAQTALLVFGVAIGVFIFIFMSALIGGLAEFIMARTAGVTGVSNQIAIKPQADANNINSDIMVALNRSWFSPEKIDVSAYDGKVTLTGTVDYWDERALAGTTAWAAPGVTSVTNDIRVH